jgi:hypothetical protein
MPYPIPTHTPDGRPYRIFFVCGHMRSGTNWVSGVLNLHPDINCFGEGPLGHFRTAVDLSRRSTFLYSKDEPYTTVVEEAFHELSRRVVLSISHIKPDAQWVGDNTTRQLWPYVPGTHHFYVLRDGRDVITSWTFHQIRIGFDIGEPFKSRMGWMHTKFKEDPYYFRDHPQELFTDEQWVRENAIRWRDYCLTGNSVMKRMREGTMDVRVLLIRYENLLNDFENQKAEMFKFLEVDPALAKPAKEGWNVTPGFKHDRPDWFFRSGKTGDWKNYENDNFNKWFKEEAGEALILTGYENNTNW